MGLFYELHKHHYGYDGGATSRPSELFYGHNIATTSCGDTDAQDVFDRLQTSARETMQTIHNCLVEIGIVFDCFGQEVEEKLKAIAEIWGWSSKRTCHNRYVNVPIAACILILSGAFGMAYAMVCGLLFPARSFPALILAVAIIYFAVMTSACILVALPAEEVEDAGGQMAGKTWWKATDDPRHLKESTPHGNVNFNLIVPADLEADMGQKLGESA